MTNIMKVMMFLGVVDLISFLGTFLLSSGVPFVMQLLAKHRMKEMGNYLSISFFKALKYANNLSADSLSELCREDISSNIAGLSCLETTM